MDILVKNQELAQCDLAELLQAKWDLEKASFAVQLTNVIGIPIEKGLSTLPFGWKERIHNSVHKALNKALMIATMTLSKNAAPPPSDRFHQFFVGISGALGGALGLVALPFELPISTGLMLRSIADIARNQGHDLRSIQTQLACLEVLALGGRPKNRTEDDNAYWMLRGALAGMLNEAANCFTKQGIIKANAPAVIRLMSAIAARFGIMVSEQMAAKAIPLLGAAGGSTINLIFMRHFQRMARGHFIVKRLEKKYGSAQIEAVYRSMAVRVEKEKVEMFAQEI